MSTIMLQVNIQLKKTISTGKKSQLFEQTYQLIVTTHWSECITRTLCKIDQLN
jgi:hypothetical protein